MSLVLFFLQTHKCSPARICKEDQQFKSELAPGSSLPSGLRRNKKSFSFTLISLFGAFSGPSPKTVVNKAKELEENLHIQAPPRNALDLEIQTHHHFVAWSCISMPTTAKTTIAPFCFAFYKEEVRSQQAKNRLIPSKNKVIPQQITTLYSLSVSSSLSYSCCTTGKLPTGNTGFNLVFLARFAQQQQYLDKTFKKKPSFNNRVHLVCIFPVHCAD